MSKFLRFRTPPLIHRTEWWAALCARQDLKPVLCLSIIVETFLLMTLHLNRSLPLWGHTVVFLVSTATACLLWQYFILSWRILILETVQWRHARRLVSMRRKQSALPRRHPAPMPRLDINLPREAYGVRSARA